MASPEDQLSGELIDPDVLPCYKKKVQVVSPPGNSSSSSAGPNSSPSCTSSGPMFGTSGTASRHKLYLLDQLPSTDLTISKLPKNASIMRLFFEVKQQVHSLVFDTTASNTSGEVGLVTILSCMWTACRHHVYCI